LTKEQKDILTGTLLGDSSISKTKNKKGVVKFEQSIIHKDYLLHLFSEFEILSRYKTPKLTTRFDKRYNKNYESLGFSLKSSESLFNFAELFLDKDNKKIVPLSIGELLTPRALAYWICDDGQTYTRGGFGLCTDNFTKEEVLLLITVLETKFQLNCKLYLKSNPKRDAAKLLLDPNFQPRIYYRIYISSKSLPWMHTHVLPHLFPFFSPPGCARKRTDIK